MSSTAQCVNDSMRNARPRQIHFIFTWLIQALITSRKGKAESSSAAQKDFVSKKYYIYILSILHIVIFLLKILYFFWWSHLDILLNRYNSECQLRVIRFFCLISDNTLYFDGHQETFRLFYCFNFASKYQLINFNQYSNDN